MDFGVHAPGVCTKYILNFEHWKESHLKCHALPQTIQSNVELKVCNRLHCLDSSWYIKPYVSV